MKVIIVEDEFLAQQELSWLIKEHSQMEIVGTFDDGLDVLKFLPLIISLIMCKIYFRVSGVSDIITRLKRTVPSNL